MSLDKLDDSFDILLFPFLLNQTNHTPRLALFSLLERINQRQGYFIFPDVIADRLTGFLLHTKNVEQIIPNLESDSQVLAKLFHSGENRIAFF